MQHPRRIGRAGGLCALVLLVATACQTPVENRGVTAVQFEDVYIPSQMRLLNSSHQSHSVEVLEASYRHGHFEYTGREPVNEACEDVLRRMPRHNWNLVEDSGGATDRKLRFERGSHSVTYHVYRHQATTLMVVDYRTDQPQER